MGDTILVVARPRVLRYGQETVPQHATVLNAAINEDQAEPINYRETRLPNRRRGQYHQGQAWGPAWA